MSLVQMDWEYYTYRNGYLYDEFGELAFEQHFTSEEDANAFLETLDIRGSIQ